MTPELKNACETIFQHHKLSPGSINWSKGKFGGQISIGLRELAKETLVRRNIIYYPNPAKKTITLINPAAVSGENFEEAELLVRNNVPVKAVSVIVERPVRLRIPEPTMTQRPERPAARLFRIASEPETTVSSGMKWYMKPLFYYFIWPACAALVSILIAYLISSIY